ncbi:hypothetical protein M0802_003628 [Mischocyttarus mexicanus]|nr:hypothetical protein M0802_003628 [Mischocyttarus mexicanus]
MSKNSRLYDEGCNNRLQSHGLREVIKTVWQWALSSGAQQQQQQQQPPPQPRISLISHEYIREAESGIPSGGARELACRLKLLLPAVGHFLTGVEERKNRILTVRDYILIVHFDKQLETSFLVDTVKAIVVRGFGFGPMSANAYTTITVITTAATTTTKKKKTTTTTTTRRRKMR